MSRLRRRPTVQLPDAAIVLERLQQAEQEAAQLRRLLFVLTDPHPDPANDPTFRVQLPHLPPGAARPSHIIGIVPPRPLTQFEINEISRALQHGDYGDVMTQLELLNCYGAVCPVEAAYAD